MLKVASPLWTKFCLTKTKDEEKLSVTQKMEKKLGLMMDTLQTEEQAKILEVKSDFLLLIL